MKIRPSKEKTIELITKSSPQCLMLFEELKTDSHGWLVYPPILMNAVKNLKVEGYVEYYRSQKEIDVIFLLFFFGKEELKSWNEKMSALSPSDQQLELDEFVSELAENDQVWINELCENVFREPNQEDIEQFSKMPEDQKMETCKRVAFLVMYILLSIHNYFAIMVFGESMVSLVNKAINGDDESMLKAIKIDHSLKEHHPLFLERIQRAKTNNDLTFLKRLANFESKPNLKGQIKFPGIYIIFAMLDSAGWLDEMSHSEILDICDAAGLDRWQNRIEDVNYITKRLQQYRRYQKTGGVSMH